MASVRRVIGGMTPRPAPIVVAEALKAIEWNLGDPKGYPAVEDMISYIVSETGLAVLGARYPGWVTSGTSETTILALLYARRRGKRRVVRFASSHYSVAKAAEILGMELVTLPVRDGYESSISLLEDVLTGDDVAVVTVGTTEAGWVDDVNAAAEIARRRGALVYVDAAFAGYVARYTCPRKAPRVLDETVYALAVDAHKVPEAPMTLGVLLTWSEDMINDLFWDAPYIPSRRQFGLLGTRPALGLAGAVEAFRVVERRWGGFRQLARDLMDAASRITRELGEHYSVRHPLETPILCLEPRGFDAHERLEALGYRAYRCLGQGIRLPVMPHTLDEIDDLIQVLRRAAEG